MQVKTNLFCVVLKAFTGFLPELLLLEFLARFFLEFFLIRCCHGMSLKVSSRIPLQWFSTILHVFFLWFSLDVSRGFSQNFYRSFLLGFCTNSFQDFFQKFSWHCSQSPSRSCFSKFSIKCHKLFPGITPSIPKTFLDLIFGISLIGFPLYFFF